MQVKRLFFLLIVLLCLLTGATVLANLGKTPGPSATKQSPRDGKIAAILKHPEFHLRGATESPDAYIQGLMGVCYRNGGRDDCYSNVATLLFLQFSLSDLVTLFAQSETNQYVFARCHEVMHFLSRQSYEKEKSLSSVFNQCNFTCHGGCYHGALEQYMHEKNLLLGDYTANMASEMPKICGNREAYTIPLTFRECIHGLGHGAMFITDADVPESLKLCDSLALQEEKEGCYSGIFHENTSSSTNTDHPSRYIRQDDSMFPCNILEEKYLPLCYRYQSSYFALLTNHDWQKTVELCMQVPQAYRRECFQTIGTNQVGFTQDMTRWKLDCELAPTKELRDVCIGGVVVSLAGRYTNDADRITSFCTLVADENKKACFRQMGFSISGWSSDPGNVARICNFIQNPQYASWCKDYILLLR